MEENSAQDDSKLGVFSVALLLLFFTIVSVLIYHPIFLGQVPFPSDIVINFPPWESVRTDPPVQFQHAELGDIVTQNYPWRAFGARAIRQGTIPLWNPYLLSGTPFLANSQSALFYPLNALYYVLPLPVAWSVKFLITLSLAGFMMALLVRSLGASMVAAVVAGLVFACSGFITGWQGWPHADTAIWLPLLFLACNLLSRSPSWSSVGLLAVALALPLSAGHPQTAFHMTLAATAFVAYRILRPPHTHPRRRRVFGFFLLAGALGFGLSAVQVIPTLEWAPKTGHADKDWGTATPHELLAFLSRDGGSNPNSAGIIIPEAAAYTGMTTLLLGSLAVFHRRKRDALFFALLVGLALPIVYGWEPAHRVIQYLPIVNGLKHWRLILLIDFGLAILAAFGLSALESNRTTRLGKGLCLMSAFLLGIFGISLLSQSTHAPVGWLHGPTSSLVFLLLGLALIVWRLYGTLGQSQFSIIVLMLIAADLISFAYGHIPFVSPREMFPKAPVFDYLATRNGGPFRVVSLDSSSGANFEMVYQVSSAAGYDIALLRTKMFFRGINDDRFDDVSLSADKVVATVDRRLDLLNVQYFVTTSYNSSFERLRGHPERFQLVFSDAHVQVFENKKVLPRAFLVPAVGVKEVPEDDDQLERVLDSMFDPERSVILPKFPDELKIQSNQSDTPLGDFLVSGVDEQINEVTLTTQTSEPAVLVLSQISYPGWKVFIDGKDAALLRPDYALTGVAVNEGKHVIRFVFKPVTFRIGVALTLASLIATLACFVVGSKTKQSPTKYQSNSANTD